MKSLNTVTLVGRLGSDVSINQLANGQEVASLSIATDDSFKDRQGEWQERTDWHRVVTFQKGLIGILRKHARKGRLVAVQGMLKQRSFVDADTGAKRYITEVQLNPINSQVQFLDKNSTPEQDALRDDQVAGDTYSEDDIPF